jgi:hypothetical protein
MGTVLLRAFTILLIVASACSSGGPSASGGNDYFSQLQRISLNARIQERGLTRQLRAGLETPEPGIDSLDVLVVYVNQSAAHYQDAVDALDALQPEEGLEDPHESYLAAWRSKLDLIVTVRDAGFEEAPGYLGALEGQAFDDAATEIRTQCEDLEQAVVAAGQELDLACDGRIR